MIKYNKKNCKLEYRKIHNQHGKSLKIMIVRPENNSEGKLPGVLWLHGGGYLLGFPEMVFMSRAIDLVTKCGAVVISPAYRLSVQEPYPAAIKDSYRALMYVKNHADELGIRSDQIMIGGESAGGGLAAALCMYARDRKSVQIAFQMPLYPMLNCQDTPSSADNHAKVWNTKRNHMAWKLYLRSLKHRNIPVYASPSKCQNYENLPPAYTFVGDAEPFYCETLEYIEELRKAGVTANVDVYPGGYHAFDMMNPDDGMSIRAAEKFCKEFLYAKENYFAPQLDEYHIADKDILEKYEFRSIRPEEADQAAAIEQICFPPNEACSKQHMKERVAKAPELFLVAVDRSTGKLAGFLNGLSTDEYTFRDEFFTDANLYNPDGKNIMLLGLDVLPEFRRQGIAKELVYRYARRERENGRQMLILTCLKAKVKMYKKMGFDDSGIANSTWGGEEWHEMTYRIDY